MEAKITMRLGQNISKTYPSSGIKSKQKLPCMGQNISKKYPASGAKRKQNITLHLGQKGEILPCTWRKT
jgi:hypothetical protein